MTRAICITAHHDDAVLWLGGTILRTRCLGWSWTIVALCVPDPNRRAYFTNYCDTLQATAASFGFKDYQSGDPFSQNSQDEFRKSILYAARGENFDWVFTHSRDLGGEYGRHANHDEVCEATRTVVDDGSLGCGTQRLVYFSYSPVFGCNGRATTARLDANFHLQLTYDELLQKCAWCMAAPDAFTNLKSLGFPCPNPESFGGDGISLPAPFIPHD